MITFEKVSKSYSTDPGAQAAVDKFSLQVPHGQLLVLLGSSGSGKTTLLRMVNRMIEPTSGRVLLNGEDVRERNPVQLRRGIGYVPQNTGLLPHRTVGANVTTVLKLLGRPKREIALEVPGLLERVGLDPALANRYPAELSGGQQQRVGVARALAANPPILLMDEPFGAVDPIVRAELQEELLRLQRELAKTIIFVTHDVEEALRLADEIVLLEPGGRISQQGSPEQLLTQPANDFVRSFLGLERGERTLRVEDGIVRDGLGRPLGIVEESR